MKLNLLEIEGFGKLVKQVYKFSPGLNLIYGRNEAGKSTLQRSILAALYGFFESGTITPAKKASMAIFEPWDKRASFGLKLAFEVEGGTQYRVERTFSPKAETILYDLKSGKSVSLKFQSSSQGRLFFAEKLLGMPREVFENTILVRQAELAALEKSASAITDTLLRLSASASQESTASQALELLEIALKEQIGTQRSRNKPLPEAQRRLEDLRVARTRLVTEHQALANQMHELAQAEESFRKLQRERDKAEYQRLLAQRMVTQYQRQNIEQADKEVERCQHVVSQYHAWSAFPADTQPKVQRLATQYEKAKNDADQAEQTARGAKKRIALLSTQMAGLHKTLNSTRSPDPLPDIETQSAAVASTALQNWLDEELTSLRNAIQAQQNALSLENEKLTRLSQVGHEGITKDRQELGKLETDLAQAKQAIHQIQQTARQAGVPEDQWETVLSDTQAAAIKWQGWSNYPAQLRDELLQVSAQYVPQKESLAARAQEISETRSKLTQLQTQVDALLQQIASLETARNIPQQEKSRIQEIVSQLESAQLTRAETYRQFTESDQLYQKEQQAFDAEKRSIEPLEQLGIAGLNQLQQRWMNATQQLASAQARFVQSNEAWGRVGMPVAEFQRLENTVKEIQSGARPAPKPRRGCRSLFMKKQIGVVDQTPTEITIYAQVQPIYAEYSRQHDEIQKSEQILRLVVDEIHQKLGQLAPDAIHEGTFADLVQRLQNDQQKAFQVEQKKGYRDTRYSNFQRSEEHLKQIGARLENELTSFGFTATNIEDALGQFYRACEQKEQLLVAETTLERLQSQLAMVKQQSSQFQTQQQSLVQTEEKIINLLSKANIQNPGSLSEGIRQFEQGLESHRQWKAAQSHLEQIQTQIADFGGQLSRARSAAAAKEENLLNFRQQSVEKFSGLLPDDFTDQRLAQLDADLQAFNVSRSGIDKAQGQLEQLQLQAQSIQRDIHDWLEKEDATIRLSNEILHAVHAAGIETDQQMPPEVAINRFDEAFLGFSQWQQAQRAHNAALQAQQAVHASLPKLETELAGLETKITQLTKQHPEWKNLTVSDKPEVYERASQNWNSQVLEERDHMTRVQDAVDRGIKSLGHLAELDEEIDLVSAEVQQLSDFGQALELAFNELTIATREFQKMFAPRLERIVEDGLEQITAGRYVQAKIDPNSLNVRVLAPERNELVETAQLSTGTRDLIYLVLRMGIAQLMSSSGEKLPLLLDDPFVEFDYPRQQAALAYLHNLSERTQVFLFTKDDQTVTWLQQLGEGKKSHHLIELT